MIKRHKNILKFLAEKNRITVQELIESLNVSGVTIRQDLSELERQGLLKRVHGGAVLNNSDNISNRMVFNYDEKLVIARKAAEYIDDGETVFIESGSTNMLLAKELAKKQNITILTTNTYIARELKGLPNINVIIMGGIYQQESESTVGNLTRICIEHVNFNKAFIGVDGYSAESGFTGKDMLRVETAAVIAAKSRETFVMIDPTKFGIIALAKIFDPDSVDYVISTEIPEPIRKKLLSDGVNVVIA